MLDARRYGLAFNSVEEMKVIHFGSFSHFKQSWMSKAAPALLHWNLCSRRAHLFGNMSWAEDLHF